ncbi:LysR family transcriptional activator of glutamate synthase operon [Rhodococcus sp. 27YEA15]|uniref:LysR family transcriptional regulator n=1 Tax=Rhodococcus sp. 27YEA15 TaxID=3156259 RepID=UPI003C79FC31
MEFRQIVYFTAVVRHGGFTRAAERLRIAQPAVSAQIRLLEKELGSALFTRTTRRVTLTPAGDRFLVHAQRILTDMDAAVDDMQSQRTVAGGRVRIGATAVTGTVRLAQTLTAFASKHPGVRLRLQTGLIDGLLDELDAGSLDVVVGPQHRTDPRFVAARLSEESLVVITAVDFGTPEIRSLSDLRECPFVCLPAGSGLRSLLDRWASISNFSPLVEFETHGPESIRALVSEGLGVALVARSSAIEPGPPIRIHHVPDVPEHPPICAFGASGRSSVAAAAFIEFICAETHLRSAQSSVRQ